MAGLLGTLNIARSGILAQQGAVRVASQNITNAETPGYTRQRADLVTARSIVTPNGILGTGVNLDNVTRLREPALDIAYRRDSGRASSSQLRSDLLSQVQVVLGEPSDTGLSKALDAFHDAWSDLANQPSSAPARVLVIQRGTQLANMLRNFTGRLDHVASQASSRLTATVDDVNRIAGQIALVNVQIVAAEAGGQSSNDLRDQRDVLLDDIAKLGTIQVVERASRDVAVILDGAVVVDGADRNELTLAGSPTEVRIGSRALSFSRGPSTLGDLLAVVNTDIPAVQQRLDALAGGMVAQVNALHSSGYTPAGTIGVNFFTPTGTTARNISVAITSTQVVTADAASEAGNNKIALGIAALRGRPAENDAAAGYAAWTAVQNNLGGLSFSEHYNTTVTTLGATVNDAENAAEVYGALAGQAEARRESVSGVSVDEELILVTQHQQAYAAAARLVNVIDEMMETLLQM